MGADVLVVLGQPCTPSHALQHLAVRNTVNAVTHSSLVQMHRGHASWGTFPTPL